MMNKRGTELIDTVVGLIVAVVVVAVLVVLVSRLIDPGYSENDAIAEAYFDRMVESVEKGEGEILMLDRGKGEAEFYLVYFGGAGSVEFFTRYEQSTQGQIPIDRTFVSSKVGEHVICVCYEKLSSVPCKNCFDLDLPASSVGGNEKDGGFWLIQDGSRVDIRKEGGRYVFSK